MIDREQISHSLRIAFGDSPTVEPKKKRSRTLKEALDSLEEEARELGKVVGKSNSGTIAEFLESLK